MVDRIIESPIEVPFCEDDLRTNRNFMVGLGKLAEALIGKQTIIQGLPCTPTTPASLKVLVDAGQIFSWQNIDDTDYSELPADTTHQIVKQGLVLDETELDCPAPVTVGFSINYLVQIAFSEEDGLNEERAFYNSADPSQPTYQYVDSQRNDKCVVTVKTGTAATTGTQVTPAPDVGKVGSWVVTVDEGQTEITAIDITEYPDAPFIKLNSTLYNAAVKNDGSNNYEGVSQPPLAAYEDGVTAIIRIDVPNTGDSTLDLGLGAVQILDLDGAALQADELKANTPYIVVYNNSKWYIQVTSKTTINKFPQGHLYNILVEVDSGDTDHDIQFGVGECRDKGNTINMSVLSAFIKRIDANWAAGSGAGGFPSALTLLPDTWYHLFTIGKIDGTVDGGYDISTIPGSLLADATGYTGYRRVGSVLTDGSENIIAFKMFINGKVRIFRWDTITIDFNIVNPGTSGQNATLKVPLGVNVTAQFLCSFVSSTLWSTVYFAYPGITSNPGPYGHANANAAKPDYKQVDIFTTVTSHVRFTASSSDANTVIDLLTIGWTE